MKRRKFFKITGFSLLVLFFAGLIARLLKTKSGNYAPYFSKLNQSLKKYKKANPFLLIDLDVLDENLLELKKLIPTNKSFRVVVKSLPSIELLNYIMQKVSTKKLMIFNQSFLTQISKYSDTTIDILFGKPMPIKAVNYYYDTLVVENGFHASKQVQWLVDTEKRINEYINFAKQNNIKLLLNIEIDVGLHRGGFSTLESLRKSLQIISKNKEHVTFSGFMGYDAHIVKVPSVLLSREKGYQNMCDFYNACKNLVKNDFQELWNDNLTFNGAGSPTLGLHNQPSSPLNDISAGSFAVMPTDFDIDTLEQFKPASFIATPILKEYNNTNLPSIESLSNILNVWDPNMQNSYYIFGGSWMANYYQPEGISGNAIFGKSTNQVMINASNETKLDVGDYVFLRPHQSEFVFLQFGEVLAIRNAKIVNNWSLLNI
ncbi:D-serine deaminase-like pyridoxal phosphate-dependent protein [Lutibacter sp. Hel_I_33_5]|uniref:alanine racemase n=1 Tax=Lutibacter sp. Hel_I_33_5 TaxID=1566289 RepID=UPI0011A69628|nr:alanine racemase [Lutibacter sp. Hel_I_33_5]TVZ55137.1 D-serine deaminase-like pyridoxal phosphate-dependent protein [Lutibacter sp. Hel_I_33_5]